MYNELNSNQKHFYAAHSYMGTNFTYDSPCWIAYVFNSHQERDQWVGDGKYNDQGNLVKEPVTRQIAFKIAGINSKYKQPVISGRGLDNCLTWKWAR